MTNLETSCWYWARAVTNTGYGHVWDGTAVRKAHRVVYEALVGDVPDGLELDHLCRNRICVNPDHLEPVTHLENVRRGNARLNGSHQRAKTQCPQGHNYTGVNNRGGRVCNICMREANRRQIERRKYAY